jgi:hypothetical protein
MSEQVSKRKGELYGLTRRRNEHGEDCVLITVEHYEQLADASCERDGLRDKLDADKLRAQNAKLVGVLADLIDRFAHVCRDEDAKTDPVDLRRIKRARAALARVKGG